MATFATPTPAMNAGQMLLGEILVRNCGVAPESIERALTKQREEGGLIEEMNRSIQSVEEDVEALGAAGRRQHVQEGAVEYGPTTIEAPDQTGHGDGTSAPVPEQPKAAPGGKK